MKFRSIVFLLHSIVYYLNHVYFLLFYLAPLTIAVKNNNLDIVQILLSDKRVNPNIQDILYNVFLFTQFHKIILIQF